MFARAISGDVKTVEYLFEQASRERFYTPWRAIDKFILAFETADKLINKYKEIK